ncbi:hypothetical protein HQQ80_07120 [Microbacteriaceae bacterium VKM Ac-2855]|nr:hypothetical protein [Microbacteriaceae bacterium VKM Ac-2855]
MSAVALAALAVSQSSPTRAAAATTAAPAVATGAEVAATAFSGSVSRTTVAAFDTTRLVQGGAIYTPIWSDDDAVYIADSTPIPWTDKTVRMPKANFAVTRIPSSGAATTTTIGSFFYDKTNVGHRNSSVAVTDDGRVIAHPATHANADTAYSPAMAIFRSRAVHDVAGFDLLESAPAGYAGSCYRRFFRDPHTKALFMVARGTLCQAIIWRWVPQLQNFVRVDRPGTSLDSGSAGTQEGLNLVNTLKTVTINGKATKVIDKPKTGGYGHEIAFMKAGVGSSVMYCVPEFTVNSDPGESVNGYPSYGQAGYPRRDIALTRSLDGGHTWQTLDLTGQGGAASATIAGPFTPDLPDGTKGNVDIVFPGPTYNPNIPAGPAQDQTRNNAVGAHVAVSGNRVVVVSNWDGRSPTGTPDGLVDAKRVRGLYARTYDAVAKKWLTPAATLIAPKEIVWKDAAQTQIDETKTYHAGLSNVAYTSTGRIVVVASDHDDHALGGAGLVQAPAADIVDDLKDGAGVPTPRDKAAGPYPATTQLFVFTSTDGVTWAKYRIDSAAAAAAAAGMTAAPAGSAYIDAPALEREGRIRLYPVFPGDPKRAEIWDVSIPGFTGTAAPQVADAPLLAAATIGNSINLAATFGADGGRAITKYHVYRGSSKTATGSGIWATMSGVNGVLDLDAPVGSTRSYQVAAVDSSGAVGTKSPIIWIDNSNRTPARPPMPNALSQSGSSAPYTFTERAPMVPTLVYRSESIGIRTNGSPLQTGDRIGTWQSTGSAATAAKGALTAVNEARTNPVSTTDSRPYLISDGPNGFPAVRFTRTAASRLLIERPTAISDEAAPITTFVVARLRDYGWHHLVSSQGASGRMLADQPHSRTSLQSHETRFTDAGLDAAGSANPARMRHTVTKRATLGPWMVYVSQWRARTDVRRISGQMNFCEGDVQEYPQPNYSTGGWWQDASFMGPTVSAAPGTPAKHMTLGSVVDMAGTRLTSEMDIAEVMRFDNSLGRPDMQRIVRYLMKRYALTESVLVPQDVASPAPLPSTVCQHFVKNADGSLNTSAVNCCSIAAWADKSY